MNLQGVINGRLGVGTALLFGRALPQKPGYSLANFIAGRIAARRSSAMVKAVRANQWVVTGERLDGGELDRAVLSTFRSTALCLYDFYHNLHNPKAADRLIRLNPRVAAKLEQSKERREGLVAVGVHMSSFDFILQAAAGWGMDALLITLPEIKAGYQWQYELRKKAGLEIKPASIHVFREAVQRLRSGGAVLTGLDRPVTDSKYRLQFFGRPARLPVSHIQLAVMAKVPVYVLAAIRQPDGIYEINLSEPVHMLSFPDRHDELVRNAERVLSYAAEFICQAPEQWSMFYPVWPEVIDLLS